MNQVTVKELAEELAKLVKWGYGDKAVILPDDNEGNGFHGCFCGATISESFIASMDANGLIHDSVETDPKNIVIIG